MQKLKTDRGQSVLNNYWNKIIYKLWSPVYDIFFNAGPFLAARKNVFHGITINHQQQVLVVGVGTGADLELLDLDGMEITAIDYSEDMLNQARKKFKDSSIQFIEMDAQQMTFADNQFDVVIGSLILSVVPHAEDCFKEMERVLKPGGEILLFDKFLPREKKLSLPKKMIRPVIKLLGTDIGLDFDRLVENNNGTLLVKEDVPVLFNGMYRKIVLSKQRI